MKRRSLGNSIETPEKANKRLAALVGIVAKTHHETLAIQATLTAGLSEQAALLAKAEQTMELNLQEPLSLKAAAQLEKELKAVTRGIKALQKQVDGVTTTLTDKILPEWEKQNAADPALATLKRQIREITDQVESLNSELRSLGQRTAAAAQKLEERQSALKKEEARSTVRTLAQKFAMVTLEVKSLSEALQTIGELAPPLTPRTITSLKTASLHLRQIKDPVVDFAEYCKAGEGKEEKMPPEGIKNKKSPALEPASPKDVQGEESADLDHKVRSLSLEG